MGRLYDALRDSGELDNTIIVFTSDNGFLLGEHGIHGQAHHAGGVDPHPAAGALSGRHQDAGRPAAGAQQDVAPSILDLAGAAPMTNIHGSSWRPLLEGRRRLAKSWFYEYNYEKQFPYTPNVRGVRTDYWNTSTTRTATGARPVHGRAVPREGRSARAPQSYRSPGGEAEARRIARRTGPVLTRHGRPARPMPVNPEFKMEPPDAKSGKTPSKLELQAPLETRARLPAVFATPVIEPRSSSR